MYEVWWMDKFCVWTKHPFVFVLYEDAVLQAEEYWQTADDVDIRQVED